MIDYFICHPKKLFVLDGFGAIISAFVIAFVLVRLEKIVGIPSDSLYILATMPLCFALFDVYCTRKKEANLAPFVYRIAWLNLIYCCLSMAIAWYHFQTISIWGWAYLLLEILVLVALVNLELEVAHKLKRIQKT